MLGPTNNPSSSEDHIRILKSSYQKKQQQPFYLAQGILSRIILTNTNPNKLNTQNKKDHLNTFITQTNECDKIIKKINEKSISELSTPIKKLTTKKEELIKLKKKQSRFFSTKFQTAINKVIQKLDEIITILTNIKEGKNKTKLDKYIAEIMQQARIDHPYPEYDNISTTENNSQEITPPSEPPPPSPPPVMPPAPPTKEKS